MKTWSRDVRDNACTNLCREASTAKIREGNKRAKFGAILDNFKI